MVWNKEPEPLLSHCVTGGGEPGWVLTANIQGWTFMSTINYSRPATPIPPTGYADGSTVEMFRTHYRRVGIYAHRLKCSESTIGSHWGVVS